MSLLSVVQDVSLVVGVLSPSSVFSGLTSNRTMQEMLSLANEMAQRIAYDNRDWVALKKTQTFNGDGVTSAFNLPADYKRMLLTSNVWRSTNKLTPMRFVPDLDQWLRRRAINISDSYGEWTIVGNQVLIAPVMGVGVSATFAYATKNCIALNSGGVGSTFQSDLDAFVLDERVFKLGMIWQWKANKGSPYNEDLATFGDALTFVQGKDAPAPIIIGRLPISAASRNMPYPFAGPTP